MKILNIFVLCFLILISCDKLSQETNNKNDNATKRSSEKQIDEKSIDFETKLEKNLYEYAYNNLKNKLVKAEKQFSFLEILTKNNSNIKSYEIITKKINYDINFYKRKIEELENEKINYENLNFEIEEKTIKENIKLKIKKLNTSTRIEWFSKKREFFPLIPNKWDLLFINNKYNFISFLIPFQKKDIYISEWLFINQEDELIPIQFKNFVYKNTDKGEYIALIYNIVK